MESWRALVGVGEAGRPLALGAELRARESSAAAHWGPRRVRTATTADLDDGRLDITVGLRPLARNERGDGWVRSGVSWETLRRGASGFDHTQRGWFTELYGIAHDVRVLAGLRDESGWLTLDDVTSALLFPHLESAAALGIPLVGASSGQSVALTAPASAALRVDDLAGGAALRADIVRGGVSLVPAEVRPIGRGGLYTVEADADGIRISLTPAPLSAELLALLRAGEPVVVPAGELRDFVREALPRLQRENDVVLDPAVILPEAEPTTLIVSVVFGGGDTLDYQLEWLREGTVREPWPVISAGDGAEASLRVAVAEAWRRAPDVPFAAEARLEGLDAAEFAGAILAALEEVDGVRLETRGRRREYRELRGDPRITLRTVETDDPDWFDLGVIVQIDGRAIPFRPLFTALALRQKKLLMVDGSYFSLAHPALDRLKDLLADAAEIAEWDNAPTISRYQLPFWEDFEDLADEALPARAWREATAELRADATPTTVSVPATIHADLRSYQREGLDRLALWWRHRLGGILADDMGLGKTLQVLALLAHAREGGERRPFLVVAPTSVVHTWRTEAERFAPSLRLAVHDTTRATRRDASLGGDGARDADVVITSYAVLRLDEDWYAAADWAIVVLDEAQFAKNPRTRLHRALSGLRADMMLAVTGTPLENSLTELWAILSLTCPGLFPSARRFREEYVKPIERGKVPENEEGAPSRERRIARLRSRLRPFVLRRTKELVTPELPERQEQEVFVDLSPAHRAIYDRVLQRERQKILGLLPDLDRQRFAVFRSLTLLRRLALAPALVDAVPAGAPGIPSAKLAALRERLRELIAEGHRALVFSQFTSYLDLVHADLAAHGIAAERLDGSTRRREEVVSAFRAGDAPVFLISLKAGGFGLTLTEADYVFLLDPWWNPAAEAQAIDRTHRIGQTRPVNVYRLIATGTIEEKVLALQRRKARLFASVMGDDDLLARSLTADDILGLLSA
ncbi:DEAD/DEAH box helicase [Microbacterium sp. bgisy203]|uniref:DEAD/DEAH box helicase n=1 Tax=Microbacterium sp. bgisy203 TaxID=3413799 RepID=UPI003D750974